MLTFLAILTGIQAQGLAPEHGMDPMCKWIIGGMAVAVLGMAGYIAKQQIAHRADLREWINSLQDTHNLLGLVEDRTTPPPPS